MRLMWLAEHPHDLKLTMPMEHRVTCGGRQSDVRFCPRLSEQFVESDRAVDDAASGRVEHGVRDRGREDDEGQFGESLDSEWVGNGVLGGESRVEGSHVGVHPDSFTKSSILHADRRDHGRWPADLRGRRSAAAELTASVIFLTIGLSSF
jgi:hypothetical protein